MAGATEDLNREWAERYLRFKWQVDCVAVTDVRRITRGISRETWLICCEADVPKAAVTKGAAIPGIVVLRRDPPGNSIDPRSLRFEYEVYARLANSAVPVARPLWYETDPTWLTDGRELYLREHVQGSWEVPNVLNSDRRYDTLRIETSKEHIRKLARVHTSDWAKLGFAGLMVVPRDVHHCASSALDRHFQDLARFQFEPFPIMTEAREWLLAHAPTAPRVCLLKGTNGLGEEIFLDGRIVAMSDWEQSSLGDPASDFARTQDFLFEIVRDGKQIWGEEQALAYYEEVCGIHIPPASVEYYRILNGIETIVSLHHAAKPVCTGASPSARSSWLATEVVFRFQKLLLDACSGLSTRYSRTFFSTPTTAEEV